MNKMVINRLEKLFVTNDAATILRELEVSFFQNHQKNSNIDKALLHLVYKELLLPQAYCEDLCRFSEVPQRAPKELQQTPEQSLCHRQPLVLAYERPSRSFLQQDVVPDRLNSKWDLRRLCKTVGATALPRLTPPVLEEMGHCDSVYLSEVGDTQVVVFKHEKEDGAISTIVLRGSTDNLMDDIERAVDDGVNTFKVLTRDKRLVPGGGATEIELAKQITSYGETCPGLEQYAIKKFAEAFEAIPRALAENSGVKANEVISKLYAVHQEGNKNVGLDIEAEVPAVKDMLEASILDTYLGKYWAIKLATNAAVTVLRVDQIIMAKPAGGPKPPSGKKDWDDDQND
ncbi:T-complex protein 1 subunit theta isoform X1 [Cricetulus griseus]|uniref:T-complex protein 1 subunit theta isoform X1 n=1 Tax=Cricetulus griseus TaxID=10029 RepID=UPI0015C33A5B|nr:T-complex protein 1 subunit theta isoform X1 [Cricetulus griseus]